MANKWLCVVALLGACGTDPDKPPMGTVTGVVDLDNAIAGATVYLDYNNNNLLDSGEPQTTTDATGHYTLVWENDGPLYPHTIGAIVDTAATRVGVSGPQAAVQIALHMRAPLAGDTSGTYAGTAVISPLTTLVVSEMTTLDRASAAAKVAAALSGSHLPFSGQPLDVMADYSADFATSPDSAQLRYAATTVAAVVSAAVAELNAHQSLIDASEATYFDPAIVVMDKQLAMIANGTFAFTQLTASQRADVEQNPGNYHDYFVNTTQLADDFEAALLAAAEDLAAEIFEAIKDKIVEQLTAVCVDLAAELLQEAIEAAI